MAPVSHEEISGEGEEDDPECLHCYLADVIDKWSEKHPDKTLRQMCAEVGEVLGEMAASDLVDLQDEAYVKTLSVLMRHVAKCAWEIRVTIKAKRLVEAQAAEQKPRVH